MPNPYRMNGRILATSGAVLVGDALITQLRAAEFTPAAVSSGGDSLSRAAARLVRTFRIGRVLTGLFLILHGLAHSRAGTVLADPERSWPLFYGTTLGTALLWITGILVAMSMLGFVAGGLGLLGVAGLRHHTRRLVLVAAIASVLLLTLAATPAGVAGAVIDLVLLGLLAFAAVRPGRVEWMWHRTLIEDAAASRS